MIPLPLRVIGWIALPLLLGLTLFIGYRAIVAFRRGQLGSAYNESLDALLFGFCGVGVALKFAMVGPDWLRFHLADLGFPIMGGCLLYALYSRPLRGNTPALVRFRIKCTYMALVVSIAYELVSGYMVSLIWGDVLIVGRFDWIDVLMYVLGTAIALAILYRWRHLCCKHEEASARLEQERCEDDAERARLRRRAAERRLRTRRRPSRSGARRKG